MPCYHPLRAAMIYDKSQAKNILMFGGGAEQFKWDGDAVGKAVKAGAKEVLLPCGKCIGCRLDYSRDWAQRCVLEAKLYTDNWWTTLTYDDEHLPLVDAIDRKTGEIVIAGTLVRKDITDFLKRLRRRWEYQHKHVGIRYYGCGEYGSKNHRPHYHVCLFNLPLYDGSYWYSKNGFATLKSEELTKCWGKGLVTVNEISWENAAYTARYMLKKAKGADRILMEQSGVLPEFSVCSRMPGIGRGYYDQHKEEIYRIDGVYVKGRIQKPAAYFDRIFQDENPERFLEIQEKRQATAEREYQNWRQGGRTTIPYAQYLRIREEAKESAAKALARKMEMFD